MEWIWFLLIGLIAGWLAGLIVKGSGYGILTDIIIGVIGSFVGGFVFRLAGLTRFGLSVGPLLTALVGAIVFIYIVRLLKKA